MRYVEHTMRGRFTLAAAALALLAAAPAEAAPKERPPAVGLAAEGRRLMAAKDYAAACPRFAESIRMTPNLAVQMLFARCLELSGRTATAWATYKEAAAIAGAAKRADLEKLARKRAAALWPQLATLKITVTDPAATIDVSVDGTPLSRDQIGAVRLVDPGKHVVTATAPEKKPWSNEIEAAPKAPTEVVVPALQDEAPPRPQEPEPAPSPPPPVATAAPPPAEPPPPGPRSVQPAVGLALAGAGVLTAGVGAYFGVRANAKNQDALKHCPNTPECVDQAGVDLTHDARRAANVSTVLFAVGGGLAAIGAVVLVTAPRTPKGTALRIGPALGAQELGLSVGRTF
jgi:hypothetical protein